MSASTLDFCAVELLAMLVQVALEREPRRALRTLKQCALLLLEMCLQVALQRILARKPLVATLADVRAWLSRVRVHRLDMLSQIGRVTKGVSAKCTLFKAAALCVVRALVNLEVKLFHERLATHMRK